MLALAFATVSVLPRESCADEPMPADVAYDPEKEPAGGTGWRLFWTGAAVTGAWYGAGVGVSYLWDDAPGAMRLRTIPVAGPYMMIAQTGCPERDPNCDTFMLVLRTLLTGLSAVGQTGGALVMLESAFVPTRARPERGEAAPPRLLRHDRASTLELQWVATPLVSDGTLGLSVTASF